MSKPLIQLKKVVKVYNEGKQNAFKALDGVSIDIEKGQFVSIVGPSGSGKSTMMNILGALDVPSSGSYMVRGVNVEQMNRSELADFRNSDVGFIFQQFNLLSRATVMDNVLMPTIYGDIEQPRERAEELLRKVGLGDKFNNKPNQLSGGQMQRVAIARALIMNPSIIMADEPTGNLDSKTAKEILDLLKSLNEEGNTIILITHDNDIAAEAQRTIKLMDGKVV